MRAELGLLGTGVAQRMVETAFGLTVVMYNISICPLGQCFWRVAWRRGGT